MEGRPTITSPSVAARFEAHELAFEGAEVDVEQSRRMRAQARRLGAVPHERQPEAAFARDHAAQARGRRHLEGIPGALSWKEAERRVLTEARGGGGRRLIGRGRGGGPDLHPLDEEADPAEIFDLAAVAGAEQQDVVAGRESAFGDLEANRGVGARGDLDLPDGLALDVGSERTGAGAAHTHRYQGGPIALRRQMEPARSSEDHAGGAAVHRHGGAGSAEPAAGGVLGAPRYAKIEDPALAFEELRAFDVGGEIVALATCDELAGSGSLGGGGFSASRLGKGRLGRGGLRRGGRLRGPGAACDEHGPEKGDHGHRAGG